MMEYLVKKRYGFTENKTSKGVTLKAFEDKPSANCNICRNFSNIFDQSHRFSAYHQNKLTERFRIIRSKMKMIRSDSHTIAVHDDQWGSNEDFWCYFCDKAVKKHQVYEEVCIEYLGYLLHLADLQHIEAVKSYLKYHGRKKEKFEWFSKTKADLEKFWDKIPEAKNKYLAKMNFIHQKDVAHIREVEAHRQILVSEAHQVPEASISGNQVSTQQVHALPLNITHKRNVNLYSKPKLCPWLVGPEKECNEQQDSEKPVIGPTIDTLKKHVADQKKKMLPVKRLGVNFKRKQVYSSHWLPSFSGIWNKGRHRQIKSNDKHTR